MSLVVWLAGAALPLLLHAVRRRMQREWILRPAAQQQGDLAFGLFGLVVAGVMVFLLWLALSTGVVTGRRGVAAVVEREPLRYWLLTLMYYAGLVYFLGTALAELWPPDAEEIARQERDRARFPLRWRRRR